MRTYPLTLAAALAATALLTGCSDDKAGGDDVKNADRPGDAACALGDMGVDVAPAPPRPPGTPAPSPSRSPTRARSAR
ncbi:hypothetical protein [Streptomyces tibetensis]|uniref:hypothetical protein n=1 Tax=Streptomyces tibetensis TaxID=2382123 RepID=UPI0033F08F54